MDLPLSKLHTNHACVFSGINIIPCKCLNNNNDNNWKYLYSAFHNSQCVLQQPVEDFFGLHIKRLWCHCYYFIYRTVKVDCITVSTSPVKSTIDDHIQQLFDALLNSLRRSIINDVQAIDTFLTSGMEALSTRPQSVEEIGEANVKHNELAEQKPQVNYVKQHYLLFLYH
jgi:hypothetical protein